MRFHFSGSRSEIVNVLFWRLYDADPTSWELALEVPSKGLSSFRDRVTDDKGLIDAVSFILTCERVPL